MQKLNQPKPLLLKTKVQKIDIGFQFADFKFPEVYPYRQYYGFKRLGMMYSPDTAQEYDMYLSGAMSGEADHNYPLFNYYAKKLRKEGFRVFNPAENFGGKTDLDREVYMRHDIKAVARSGAIFVLPDYEDSEGVATELNTALGLRMPVFIASHSENSSLPLIRQYDSYEN